MNSITDTIKRFFDGVQEFHPTIDNCDDMSVEEISRRVKQMAKSTDGIFKKETQCANDKCDENFMSLMGRWFTFKKEKKEEE